MSRILHSRGGPFLVRRLCGATLAFLLLAAACRGQPTRPGKPIVIAADASSRQQVLAEVTAQYLRAQGYAVQRQEGLREEWMTRKAIEAGSVGLLWQETGHVWRVYLNHDQPIASEAELLRRVREEDRLRGVIWLNPVPWSSRMSLVVTNDLAARHRLASIADLAQHVSRTDPRLVLCAPQDLYDSARGIRGLERVYQFRFRADLVRTVPFHEGYEGLLEGSCDVALGYAKDLGPYGGRLVALRDGRAFFPASSLAPTVHRSVLAEYPELERVMAELAGTLDATSLAEMERSLAQGRGRVDRLAAQYLRDAGLLARR